MRYLVMATMVIHSKGCARHGEHVDGELLHGIEELLAAGAISPLGEEPNSGEAPAGEAEAALSAADAAELEELRRLRAVLTPEEAATLQERVEELEVRRAVDDMNRKGLQGLKRPELVEIAKGLGIEVAPNQGAASLTEAIVAAKRETAPATTPDDQKPADGDKQGK